MGANTKYSVIPLTETAVSVSMKGKQICSKELYEFTGIVQDQNITLVITDTQAFNIQPPNQKWDLLMPEQKENDCKASACIVAKNKMYWLIQNADWEVVGLGAV